MLLDYLDFVSRKEGKILESILEYLERDDRPRIRLVIAPLGLDYLSAHHTCGLCRIV